MSLTILLDTHALLWWTHQPGSLSKRALAAIEDGSNEVFVSPVSAFEIATKNRKGLLSFVSPLAHDFVAHTASDGFHELAISCAHAQLAGSFDNPHKDPWDRLLAAQARQERLTLVTCDPALNTFGISTLW